MKCCRFGLNNCPLLYPQIQSQNSTAAQEGQQEERTPERRGLTTALPRLKHDNMLND